MTRVTRILNAIAAGNRRATDELLPLVYDELRRLAAQRLAHEKSAQTLDATGLVHEAYLRLIGPGDAPRWEHRGHFFAAAAIAMRRILVEQARRKNRVKHGGGLQRIDAIDVPAVEPHEDLPALDEALSRLAEGGTGVTHFDRASVALSNCHLHVAITEPRPTFGGRSAIRDGV